MLRAALVTGLLLLAAACATPMVDFDEPTVELVGLRPLPAEGLEARFGLRLQVQNPNTKTLDIEGLAYQVYLREKKVLSGVSSQAVIEYFDSQRAGGEPLFPATGPERFDAITRLALSDMMFELTVQMVMEGWYPKEEQHLKTFTWVWPKTERGLAEFNAQAEKGWSGFDVGHVGMLQMISYTDFRNAFYGEGDLVHPGFDWRAGHDALAAWYDEAIQRPSVTWFFNKDFEGDRSADFFRAQVNGVLAAQGKEPV